MKNHVFKNETMAPMALDWGRGMSPKRGFLFPEKMVWRFRGVQRRTAQNVACPKNGVSYLEKNMVEFNDVFSIVDCGCVWIEGGPLFIIFVVARIKSGPRMVICVIVCFLQSGDPMHSCKCKFSAKSEYHCRFSVSTCK
jgi:hypothetical protein